MSIIDEANQAMREAATKILSLREQRDELLGALRAMTDFANRRLPRCADGGARDSEL